MGDVFIFGRLGYLMQAHLYWFCLIPFVREYI
jgi:hypothetical protein